jgi:hypothetical protein
MPMVQAVSLLDGTFTTLLEQEISPDSAPLHPPGPVPIYLLHSVFQI